MKTIVIIPVFNEESTIQSVIADIKNEINRVKIVVIDDCSTDKTAELAVKSGATVLYHSFRMGYGATVQTGYKYAVRHRFNLISQMDGDGQHRARDLNRLLRDMSDNKEIDVIVGSRYLECKYNGSLITKLGSSILAKVTSIIIGQKITDPTSGLIVMNEKAANICTYDIFPTDYPDADTLIMLKRAGLKIKEYPVFMEKSPRKSRMFSGINPLFYSYKMSISILVTLLRGRPAK